MKKIFITSLASLFIFPLTFMPDAPAKCADVSYKFRTAEETQAQRTAADLAKAGFCKVVQKNVEITS